jgi:hypothetical protein
VSDKEREPPSAAEAAEAAAEWAKLVKVEEAKAAAEWAELVRSIGPRINKPLSVDIGPAKRLGRLEIRRRGPLPPRERGLASMERGLRHAYEVVSKDNSYRFIRSGIIGSMCCDVDDVAELIDELVVDDEKAGLLMERITALALHWASFERGEGQAASARELASHETLHATRKSGADKAGERRTTRALAKWDGEPKLLWEVNQRDRPLELRMTNEDLIDLILDEAADAIKNKKTGKLPSIGTVEGHIRRWRKAADMSNVRSERPRT